MQQFFMPEPCRKCTQKVATVPVPWYIGTQPTHPSLWTALQLLRLITVLTLTALLLAAAFGYRYVVPMLVGDTVDLPSLVHSVYRLYGLCLTFGALLLVFVIAQLVLTARAHKGNDAQLGLFDAPRG